MRLHGMNISRHRPRARTRWDGAFPEATPQVRDLLQALSASSIAVFFADAPTDCCDPILSGVPSTLACFVENDFATKACLDPVPLLGNPRSPRCSAAMPCVEGAVCVRPSDDAHLVRIWIEVANDANTKTPEGTGEEIVIWNGDREEVREAGEFVLHACKES